MYADGLPLSLAESPYFRDMVAQPWVALSEEEEEEEEEGSSSGGDFSDED